MSEAWVCLDVGETLIDETRVWRCWADVLGVPPLTLAALLGAAIATGDAHAGGLAAVAPDWRTRLGEVEARYGGFTDADLYPDAKPAIARLHDAGYRVAVVANQPASRTAELRALGIDVAVMAMSDELGVAKPDARFFAAALGLMGNPDPARVAYVGDRVDNDVEPAADAGMVAVHVVRGPWGWLQRGQARRAALQVSDLEDLVARLPDVLPAR